MTVWSWDQVWSIWTRNGGDHNTAQWATAVAMAESGGNDQAVSPSDDWGLWQINAIHFAEFHTWAGAALNPDNSARMAISISQNGRNWAAWCTAWMPAHVHNCGSGWLPIPEVGSPAYQKYTDHLGSVVSGPILPNFGQNGPGLKAIHTAWSSVGSFFKTTVPDTGRYSYGVGDGMIRARKYWTPPR